MNPSAIPDAPTSFNLLERSVWYADRLREADVPFNPGSHPDELAAIYHGYYEGDYTPDDNGNKPRDGRHEHLHLERALDGASFILHEPSTVPAAWGDDDQVLWAEGEGLMLVGPDGVGKTTVAQQLVLARIGIHNTFLGFNVTQATGKVLYIAADRPRQASRSFARMVTQDNEAELRDRLIVWRGPLPFDPCQEQRALADLAELLGATDIIIDSLKDIALDLTKDETGSRVNLAFQEIIARGIELCSLHHQRKEGRDGTGKPKRLADVYGSRWLTAGMGSVLCIWGEPGDAIVELTHLKQPAEDIGPLEIRHDHQNGRTTITEGTTTLDILHEYATTGLTATKLAERLFKTEKPDRNQREKARRQLESLVKNHRATRCTIEGGVTAYQPHA